jgi:hypothetical protein
VRDARRSFLKALALAPLAPEAVAGPQKPPAPTSSAPAAAPLPPAPATGPEAVAEALTEAVRREHGAHLDAAGLSAVKKEIARALESAAKMRAALPLANGDQPVTLFSARVRR